MDRRGFLKNLSMAAAGGALGLHLPAEAASQQTSLDALKTFQRLITPRMLQAQVYYLASDLFEGRETGSRGQRMAASYLASEYQRMGLEPRGTGSAGLQRYLQGFPLYRLLPRSANLQVRRAGSSRTFRLPDPAAGIPRTGALRDTDGGVVFAGYGIADDQLGYNDYAALRSAGASLDGKWVLILDHEPLQDADRSLLKTADGKPSQWTTTPSRKLKALLEAGRPAGLLIVTDSSPRQKKPFAEQAADARALVERGGIPLSLEPRPAHVVPTLSVARAFADELLAPSGQSVPRLQETIARSLKPAVLELADTQLAATFELFPAVETENVVAVLPGSDPRLRDEFVILSAHYDHVGVDPRVAGDGIYNGASDDGSGTAATLAAAEAFARAHAAGHGPARSVAFLNFTAEERGLVGSAFYVDRQPAIPIERTAALVHMDGVAGFDLNHPRKSKNYLYLVGDKGLSEGLEAAARRLNQQTGTRLELDAHDQFPSDHSHFGRRSVPYLYFSTGLVEHHHKVTDEPQSLDYDHLARAAQLVFATAWHAANVANAVALPPRQRLTGYVCPPCPFGCDDPVYDSYGVCPVCGMGLVGKYERG